MCDSERISDPGGVLLVAKLVASWPDPALGRRGRG